MAAYWILVLTVGTALARPKVGSLRIQPHWAALTGAALMLSAGILPLAQAGEALRFLSQPVITIVSLMVITIVAERAGLFRVVAWWVARLADGNGRALFTYLFITGAVTGTLFTNDAAVLIFTPLVFQLVEQVRETTWTGANRLPYYFAVLYVANLVGAFVTSNPINIVVAQWFGLGFVEYARWMMLPAVVSMVVSYGGLRIYFRRDLPRRCGKVAGSAPVEHPGRLALSSLILLLTVAGFWTEGLTGLPTAAVAAAGAALLVLQHLLSRGQLGEVVRGVGWDVIAFVVGIFLVAMGLRAVGFTETIGRLLTLSVEAGRSVATLVTALTAGSVSAVINNHPVAGTMAIAIGDLPLRAGLDRILALSALIGGDLGPKMLPIGSLAALMWFRILRDRGVEISYGTYIRIGIPVTLAAILLAVGTLNLELALTAAPPAVP